MSEKASEGEEGVFRRALAEMLRPDAGGSPIRKRLPSAPEDLGSGAIVHAASGIDREASILAVHREEALECCDAIHAHAARRFAEYVARLMLKFSQF